METTYLKLVSQTLQEERKKKSPRFAELYRIHGERLRRIAASPNPTTSRLAGWLLKDLLLAQTIPMSHAGVDDTRDAYTGEQLPICTRQCDNLIGDGDTYMCLTGVTCLLGDLCPWELDPSIPQGSVTWLNLPMPAMTLGISTSTIEEQYQHYLEVSTSSLTSEDDVEPELRTHWAQSYDDWDELRDLREDHKDDYDLYYEAIGLDMYPSEKFKLIVGPMTRILDVTKDSFLDGDISEITLAIVFYRFCNGVALNYQGNGKLKVQAKLLRRKYMQWLKMTADNLHLIPDSDPGVDWFEEDGEMIDRWAEYFDQQESEGYREVDWLAEKAYRQAACGGGPKDAKHAAKAARKDYYRKRDDAELARLEQYAY